jgi:hypothetical protein
MSDSDLWREQYEGHWEVHPAYRRGYEDQQRNPDLVIADNPYDKGTREYQEWSAGVKARRRDEP